MASQKAYADAPALDLFSKPLTACARGVQAFAGGRFSKSEDTLGSGEAGRSNAKKCTRRKTIPSVFFAVLQAIALLILPVVGRTALAQAAPVSARQALASGQYAGRLAGVQLSKPSPPSPQMQGPQFSAVLYRNGSVNGRVNAWAINTGHVVSDSFVLPADSTLQGLQFFVWLPSRDFVTRVSWSITSQPNAGTTYGSGTINVADTFLFTNDLGFSVDQETISFLANVPMNAGTYFLNLSNAQTARGEAVYWDQNADAACQDRSGSSSCPSKAYENAGGTIPSEGFQIYGTSNSLPAGSKLEFVTKGDDGVSMVTQEFTYNSVPCPRISAHVDDFVLGADATTAYMTISGVVTDEASDIVDPDSGEQLQTLQVSLERSPLGDPISLQNTAAPELPWKPYKFRAPFSTRFTFLVNETGTLAVNLTTSENVAGCASTATLYVNALNQDQTDVSLQADSDSGTFLPSIIRLSIPSGSQLLPPYPQVMVFGQSWDLAEGDDGYLYAVDSKGNKVVFLPAAYTAGYEQVQKIGDSFSATVLAANGPVGAIGAVTGLEVMHGDVIDMLEKSLKNVDKKEFKQGTKPVFVYSPKDGFDHKDDLLETEILWRYVRTKDTVAKFSDSDSFKRDVAFRQYVVAATRNAQFGFSGVLKLNPDYWEGVNVNPEGKAKGSAFAALADVFDPAQRKQYATACEMAATFTLLRGAAQAWEESEFNKQVNKKPYQLSWRVIKQGAQKDTTTWLPGDWGYIASGDTLKNIMKKYGADAGLYVGENVIYVGGSDKGDGKFYGNFSTTPADFTKKAYFWGHFGNDPSKETKTFSKWIAQVESWTTPQVPAVVQDSRDGLQQPFFVIGAIASDVELQPSQFKGGTITIAGQDYEVIDNIKNVVWTKTYPEITFEICSPQDPGCKKPQTGAFSLLNSKNKEGNGRLCYLDFLMKNDSYKGGTAAIAGKQYRIVSNASTTLTVKGQIVLPFKLTDTKNQTQEGNISALTPK